MGIVGIQGDYACCLAIGSADNFFHLELNLVGGGNEAGEDRSPVFEVNDAQRFRLGQNHQQVAR